MLEQRDRDRSGRRTRRRPRPPRGGLRRRAGAATASRATDTIRIYNLLAFGKLYEAIPVHEQRAAGRRARARPGVPRVVVVVDQRSCPGRPRSRSTPTTSSSRCPKPHVPTVCNTMWALTDFTAANGATRVVPGSHLADHSPDYGAPLRQRRRRDAARAACSCGTAASGTAAARTRPASDASASR